MPNEAMPWAAAIAAGSQIYDIASQDMRNEKQYHLQKRLYDVQDEHQRQMAEFNQANQMETWKATGPIGQMEQLKAAGLNPGLIYGMGGAGGQTAQAAQAQGVGTSHAQQQTQGQGIAGMGIQLASQLGLIKAQTENIQASTAKTKAETGNVPLTGQNIEANTASLTQGIQNAKAQEEMTKAQTAAQAMQNIITGDTLENQIATINTNLSTAMAHMKSAIAISDVDAATINQKIEIVKQEAIGAALKNMLTDAQTKGTLKGIEVNDAQINKMAQDILQGWKGLDQGDTRNATEKFKAIISNAYPGIERITLNPQSAGNWMKAAGQLYDEIQKHK